MADRRRRFVRLVLGAVALGVVAGVLSGFAVNWSEPLDGGIFSIDEITKAAGALDEHPKTTHFVPDGTELSDCAGDRLCYEQAFGNVAYREGGGPAVSLLAEKLKTELAVE